MLVIRNYLFLRACIQARMLVLSESIPTLNAGRALSFDPFSKREDFHWTTKTSSELNRVIEEIQEIPVDKVVEQQQKARAYFAPVNEEKTNYFRPI